MASDFDPAEVQLSTLLSIKTGGCPEDCGYCPQSVRYQTGVADADLLPIDSVVCSAAPRRTTGRPGSAWVRRGADRRQRDLERVVEMVRAVKALGLETCATLGMLKPGQADDAEGGRSRLLQSQSRYVAGLLRRDHRTRTYDDRLDTLEQVRAAGLHVCCRRYRRHGRNAPPPRRTHRATREPRSVSRERADQRSRAGRGHAPERHRAIDPFEFIRTHRVRPDHDADRLRAALRGTRRCPRPSGVMLPRRRELQFLRREAARHRQPGGVADQALFDKLGLRATR